MDLVEWIDVPQFVDPRGRLSAIEFNQLPFQPVRVFFVTDVPAGESRGGHSHSYGEQILICLSGRVEIDLKSDSGRFAVICESSGKGLLVRAGTWSRQTYLVPGTTLLVLCSYPYSPDSYVDEAHDPAP